jgi:hypothetical protein
LNYTLAADELDVVSLIKTVILSRCLANACSDGSVSWMLGNRDGCNGTDLGSFMPTTAREKDVPNYGAPLERETGIIFVGWLFSTIRYNHKFGEGGDSDKRISSGKWR